MVTLQSAPPRDGYASKRTAKTRRARSLIGWRQPPPCAGTGVGAPPKKTFALFATSRCAVAFQASAASSGLSRFGLADDRRDRCRHGLGPVGEGRRALALHARVPPLAGGALLVRRQLGAVRVADEPDARPARTVRAALDAAAHVERPPRPL